MNPNYWYPLEWSAALGREQVRETRFWGQSLAIFRGADGVVRALENRCAHRQLKLSEGHVRGCNLACMYHGWTYDQAGTLVDMQHDHFGGRLPVVRIASYPVRERYGLIWGFMGDARHADAVPLPEIAKSEGPDAWASIRFDYTWRAHHHMVIDNLCNLTHLYVHGKWVPYDETRLAEHRLVDERIELLWTHTLRRDFAVYPLYRRIFGTPGDRGSSLTHMVYDYPYQRALTNDRVRSCNFMLPMDADHTRVFSIQYWRAPEIPLLRRPVPRRLMQGLWAPAIRPWTKEIFRQDGATVEGEHAAVFGEHFDKPMPEPNPSVRLFERLSIDRWQAHLDDGAAAGHEPGLNTAIKRL